MKRISVFFGSKALELDWDRANIDAALREIGIEVHQPFTAGDVERINSGLWAWVRRHILRTMIYAAWERRGSVTAKTKLIRRRAIRLRLVVGLCRLIDRYVADGVRLARAIEAMIPVGTVWLDRLAGASLVVVATDVYRGQEADLVKAARRLGIPVLVLVASFDTITSKGDMTYSPYISSGPFTGAAEYRAIAWAQAVSGVLPNGIAPLPAKKAWQLHVGVWGEASAEHASRFWGFPTDHIHVVGSLRLDALEPTTQWGPEQWVMVAGTSLAYMEHEEALVHHLADLGKRHNFRVWYRPHPRRRLIGGGMPGEHHVRMWEAFGVHLDRGATQPEGRGHLAMILSRMKVVVTAFSTLVIQAALQGTPSILVAYGPSTGGSDGEPGFLLDHSKFEHMAEVASWPGVWTAPSERSLDGMVRERVRHTSWMRGDLRRCANTVAISDGRTVERLVTLIASLVSA